jgi:hypothetical protein
MKMTRKDAINMISSKKEEILNMLNNEKSIVHINKYYDIINTLKKEWQIYQELDHTIYCAISEIQFQIDKKIQEYQRIEQFLQEEEKQKKFKIIQNNQVTIYK